MASLRRSILPLLTAMAAALSGCASSPPPAAPYSTASAVDFSGAWEIDYSRSDDVTRALRSLLLQLSHSPGAVGRVDPVGGTTVQMSSPTEDSVDTLISLARLAGEITRPQVLQIDQGEYAIEVDRGDDTFALTCTLFPDRPHYEEGPLATEVCGWEQDRLVFRATLPDGLTISHRFTLAPDAQQLHIATTLSAPGAAAPFTLNRFYRRFEPLPSRYACEDTLTRGRVCRPARD